jgi:hypothetical protein
VRSGREVLDGVLVAAAGSELHHPLNLNIQRFQLLPDSVLRHPLAQILYQQSHTAIIQKRESVETHTIPSVKETQGAEYDSEAVCFRWDDHQLLGRYLGREVTVAGCTKPCQESSDISYP